METPDKQGLEVTREQQDSRIAKSLSTTPTAQCDDDAGRDGTARPEGGSRQPQCHFRDAGDMVFPEGVQRSRIEF